MKHIKQRERERERERRGERETRRETERRGERQICLSLKIDSVSWQTYIHWLSIKRLRDLFLIMVIVRRVLLVVFSFCYF